MFKNYPIQKTCQGQNTISYVYIVTHITILSKHKVIKITDTKVFFEIFCKDNARQTVNGKRQTVNVYSR